MSNSFLDLLVDDLKVEVFMIVELKIETILGVCDRYNSENYKSLVTISMQV